MSSETRSYDGVEVAEPPEEERTIFTGWGEHIGFWLVCIMIGLGFGFGATWVHGLVDLIVWLI